MLFSVSPASAPKPDIQHLFYTNDPPDNETATAVKEIIRRSNARIQSLSDSDDADVACRQLRCIVDQHKRLLSPIRRLPTEILCEIFLAVKSASHVLCIHDLDPRIGAWVLGRVCSRWRDIALNICRPLWTTLDVIITNPMGHWSEKHAVQVLKEYLQRSGCHPLDVSLLFTYIRTPRIEEIPEMSQYLDIIVGQSSRWKSLQFSANEHIHLSGWILRSLSRAENNVPLLQRIYFSWCWDLSNFNIILGSAPLLHEITTGFHLERDRVPWHQLTHYIHTIANHDDNKIMDYGWIFEHAPNLVECIINASETHPGPSSDVVLHDLRHLEVMSPNGLDALTAPVLQCLVAPYDETLASFLCRSPDLRKVTITGPISGIDFLKVSDCMKQVRTLGIVEATLDSVFIEELSRLTVLPELRTLDLECSNIWHSQYVGLLDMLEARRKAALRYSMITLCGKPLGPEWEASVSRMRENGRSH